MKVLVKLFAALDRAVQKRFDSVCFFLMRRFGLRKSVIRLSLFIGAIAFSLVGLLASAASGFLPPIALFGHLANVLWPAFPMILSWRADRLAESSSAVRSRADLVMPALIGTLKLLFAGLAVWSLIRLQAITCLPALETAPDLRMLRISPLAELLFCLAVLALLYLLRTPMNPPPEKEKSPARRFRFALSET